MRATVTFSMPSVRSVWRRSLVRRVPINLVDSVRDIVASLRVSGVRDIDMISIPQVFRGIASLLTHFVGFNQVGLLGFFWNLSLVSTSSPSESCLSILSLSFPAMSYIFLHVDHHIYFFACVHIFVHPWHHWHSLIFSMHLKDIPSVLIDSWYHFV